MASDHDDVTDFQDGDPGDLCPRCRYPLPESGVCRRLVPMYRGGMGYADPYWVICGSPDQYAVTLP